MRWGNCLIKSIEQRDFGLEMTGVLELEDKDFKNTKKVNWLANEKNLLVIISEQLNNKVIRRK